ncbi:MAG: cytoplasmic protein [Rickettsiaceae bacterium]|jgi:predicted nuclease of restriction endonuclease-like (RecB) superfamily|nr:cytoplasmic protein [Rickettsiaceae bacterium]
MNNNKKIRNIKTDKIIHDIPNLLIKDISILIDEAKSHIAREYNSTQALLCWLIGKRIDEEVLKSERAEYGETIVASLSTHLTHAYGKGYSRPNLFRMIRFAKLFPDSEIVSTLSRQLSWSHFVLICAIDDDLKRDFYAEMCRVQRWSVRTLQKQLDSMLYERVALSKKPESVIKLQLDTLKNKDEMTPELTFKEPYFLNFIGANEYHSEEDLENLILNNITDFLQELGTDFCFVARQKRMSTGKKDRYLDLLFFNRRLRRLIAIDLKLGDFDPAYKGQMEWYLNWLDKNERFDYEEKPMGIILCAGKDHDDIEYLEMDKTGIHVAQYLTEMPSKEVLEAHLRKAIAIAKENHFKKSLLKD